MSEYRIEYLISIILEDCLKANRKSFLNRYVLSRMNFASTVVVMWTNVSKMFIFLV